MMVFVLAFLSKAPRYHLMGQEGRVSLIPRPLPDFITQLWRNSIKSESGLGRRLGKSSDDVLRAVIWTGNFIGRHATYQRCHEIIHSCK